MLVEVVRFTAHHYKLPWNEMRIATTGKDALPGTYIHIFLDSTARKDWSICCMHGVKEHVIRHALECNARNSQAIILQTEDSFNRTILKMEFDFDLLCHKLT